MSLCIFIQGRNHIFATSTVTIKLILFCYYLPLLFKLQKRKKKSSYVSRCLVTFRFWHVRGYENTRRASRWVPADSTLLSLCSHIAFLSLFLFLFFFFLYPVFLQVSSHLQVLAKRKSREIQFKLKVHMLTAFAMLAASLCMSPQIQLDPLNQQRCLCQGLWQVQTVSGRLCQTCTS